VEIVFRKCRPKPRELRCPSHKYPRFCYTPTMMLLADEKKQQLRQFDLEEKADGRRRKSRRYLICRQIAIFLLTIGAIRLFVNGYLLKDKAASVAEQDICPQVEPWKARKGALPAVPSASTLARLISGAVQVNTSVYDDYPSVSADPQVWQETFAPFQKYLEGAFPITHSSDKVKKEIVNQHGLLYTWTGSDSSLKPIIFMAHQDVVPVDDKTISKWTHPPFSGFIDDKEGLVYGRGSSDDKASLISLLASFESLLPHDFKPRRSIILSFGFDEESSGTQGGEALANHLESVYGSHKEGEGVLMIVDEGSGLDNSTFGIPVAAFSVAEKGYLDVKISVVGKGGHSSEPPKHTQIGILAKIISNIEDNPPVPSLVLKEDGKREDSPGLKMMLCVRDAPKVKGTVMGKALERLSKARKEMVKSRDHCMHSFFRKNRERKLIEAREAYLQAAREDGSIGNYITTQAVDLISGGVKINALPEEAYTVINHRIDVEETVQSVRDRLTNLVEVTASKYGCHVATWGASKEEAAAKGSGCSVILEDAYDSALESAPRTPTEGPDAMPYRLLSSVIRSSVSLENDQSIRVVPTLMQGNTDTKSYHALSQHIFRFSPNSLQEMKGPADGGIHTVDERVQIDTLTQMFKFYTSLMTAVQDEYFL
jgi:Gly-Xaa carboxypeptidase